MTPFADAAHFRRRCASRQLTSNAMSVKLTLATTIMGTM
jgi:hypothetical protein